MNSENDFQKTGDLSIPSEQAQHFADSATRDESPIYQTNDVQANTEEVKPKEKRGRLKDILLVCILAAVCGLAGGLAGGAVMNALMQSNQSQGGMEMPGGAGDSTNEQGEMQGDNSGNTSSSNSQNSEAASTQSGDTDAANGDAPTAPENSNGEEPPAKPDGESSDAGSDAAANTNDASSENA